MGAKTGRISHLSGSRVVGLVSCVPAETTDNAKFVEAFGDKAREIEAMTGVKERRWAAPHQTTADLCQAAGERLLSDLGWARDSVDAVIFVSQTPDYVLPATACALHGRLGLSAGAIAFDVNLGCSGYPYGLWLAMSMIAGGAADRVLLLVGDTISKTVDPADRATAMLFGDAGTATAVERGGDHGMTFVLGSDGRGERHLIIPAGRHRTDFAADGAFADRKLDSLYMDGGEIFSFTLAAVPALVAATADASGHDRADYDAVLLHQANAFMLKHLIKKSKLAPEKVPVNIDRFGNTSSATLPLLMTTDLAERLRATSMKLGLFGFGVGYSWASASGTFGPLAVARTIEITAEGGIGNVA